MASFLFIRLLPLIIYLIAIYYTYILFRDMSVDTTSITNSAFAIVASLAALSFSCSRSLTDSNDDKDRFSYAGERFFHTSLLLISASLIKYLVLSILSNDVLEEGTIGYNILSTTTGAYISIIFFWSVTSASGALIIINKLLWKRFNRYPEWDNFI